MLRSLVPPSAPLSSPARTLRAGGKGVVIESQAWSQLTGGVGQNVNAGLAKLGTRADAVNRVVRARTVGGERSAFAIVSERYAACDAPAAMDLLLGGLRDAGIAAAARAEVTYDAPSTAWAIRAILQAPIDVPAFAGVGRVHQVFVDLRGADNGTSSIRGKLGAIRIRCLNASLSQATGLTMARRHVGDVASLRSAIAAIPAQFGKLATEMRSIWSAAAANWYLDADGGNLSAPEAIARLVAHEYLPTCGATEAEAVDRYVAAWRAEESPHSAMGVVMAVQRAAHEGWSTRWASDEIEAAASTLLYRHVNVLSQATA